jgi:hypothetical protein
MNQETIQLYETIQDNIFTSLANLHTFAIAKVTAVQAKTISCQPVIQRVVNKVNITLPEFIEVPPMFMQGGSSYTAHPIAVGDYCLLLFSERCFDRWYEGQDFRPPAEFRMHDYSDAVAIVGLNNRAGAITIPDVIQQTGDTNQDGNYTHQGSNTQTGNYTLTGNMVQVGDMEITGDFTLNGDMQVNGNITCTGTISAANFTGPSGAAMTSTASITTSEDVVANGISLNSHTHPESEGGTTGGPT